LTNKKVKEELDKIIKEHPDFTGKCEINYKAGRPMDINTTIRISLKEQKTY